MPMVTEKEELGKRIRRLRRIADMTQKQLADACGVPLGSLRNYEQGVSYPKALTLARIARVLGVTTDSLLADVNSSGQAEE